MDIPKYPWVSYNDGEPALLEAAIHIIETHYSQGFSTEICSAKPVHLDHLIV